VATQAKLLRALEQRELQPLGAPGRRVDVRIIAAPTGALEEGVKSGRLPRDLSTGSASHDHAAAPAHRRETSTISPSVFLDEVSMELRRPVRRIAEEAMQALLRHDWPGNVRELKNVIRKAALRGDRRGHGRTPPRAHHGGACRGGGRARARRGDLSLREVAELAAVQAERELIRHALQATRQQEARRPGSCGPTTRRFTPR